MPNIREIKFDSRVPQLFRDVHQHLITDWLARYACGEVGSSFKIIPKGGIREVCAFNPFSNLVEPETLVYVELLCEKKLWHAPDHGEWWVAIIKPANTTSTDIMFQWAARNKDWFAGNGNWVSALPANWQAPGNFDDTWADILNDKTIRKLFAG